MAAVRMRSQTGYGAQLPADPAKASEGEVSHHQQPQLISGEAQVQDHHLHLGAPPQVQHLCWLQQLREPGQVPALILCSARGQALLCDAGPA